MESFGTMNCFTSTVRVSNKKRNPLKDSDTFVIIKIIAVGTVQFEMNELKRGN
jgi:hypothetical protein